MLRMSAACLFGVVMASAYESATADCPVRVNDMATVLATVFVVHDYCGLDMSHSPIETVLKRHGHNPEDFLASTGRYGDMVTSEGVKALEFLMENGREKGCKEMIEIIESLCPDILPPRN